MPRMYLKQKHTQPPGGVRFFQPELQREFANMMSLEETADWVIKARKANPRFNLSTDFWTVVAEIEQFTCASLVSQFGDKSKAWVGYKRDEQNTQTTSNGIPVIAKKVKSGCRGCGHRNKKP